MKDKLYSEDLKGTFPKFSEVLQAIKTYDLNKQKAEIRTDTTLPGPTVLAPLTCATCRKHFPRSSREPPFKICQRPVTTSAATCPPPEQHRPPLNKSLVPKDTSKLPKLFSSQPTLVTPPRPLLLLYLKQFLQQLSTPTLQLETPNTSTISSNPKPTTC